MTSRKVPPPPPDAGLSPFEVGAYLAGHVPEYAVHTIQTGGTTQAERIELHRRYLTPDGFAAWLETEDAKRTEVDPVRVVECSGFGGSISIEQNAEAWGELQKPPAIQAVHLAKVKMLRKAEDRDVRERAGASKGGSAANLTGYGKAFRLASKIRKSKPGISTRDLAKQVKAEGGSRVTAEAETLRKIIAIWEKEGKIPKSTATPGRKPKRGRKKR